MSDVEKEQVPILHLNKEQILALASAPCNEVFSTLSPSEALSAREVGQAIGRSPSSVSEQIAKLVEVGLVIHAGSRKRRSRTESTYLHRGQVNRFILKDQPKDALDAYVKRFSGHMRLAERQFEAFQDALLADPTFQDFLVYKVMNVHLSRENALRLQLAVGEILELIRSMDEPDASVREQGDYVRVGFCALLLPAVQESVSVANRPKTEIKKT